MLVRETDVEALVIKIHRVKQGGCRAVVEIGGARGEPPQNRPLDPANILALPGNQGATRIGDNKSLLPQADLPVQVRVNTGNPEMSRAGGALAPASAMPMFKGALTE